MLNAKSKEERTNLELRLCELLLGSTVLSGHDFFSRLCSHAYRGREREREKERERERERERESRQNLPLALIRFQWLSQRSQVELSHQKTQA